ncbi:MAG: L,D-transpeptidase [Deltaproteobacteria bacterium]|nr:L,D-transpeptidase [Deltaproteobacteria bacterium]
MRQTRRHAGHGRSERDPWWKGSRGAVLGLVALAAAVTLLGRCTSPPRAPQGDAEATDAPSVAVRPAGQDSGGFVPVPAVRPEDAGAGRLVPEPDAGGVAAEPADAEPADAAPPLSEEELFEIQYPMHAVVTGNLSPVYHKADSNSTRLGYLRKGARIRLGLKVDRGRGCVGGNWYPLPEKGFVCSRSLKVDLQPLEAADAPRGPDRDEVLPYRYGQNRQHRTYALTRLPTTEELTLVHRRREELLQADEARRAAELAAAAAADAGAADAETPLVELDGGEPDGEAPPPDQNRKPVVAQEGEFEHMPGTELPEGSEPPPPPAVDAGTTAPPDAGTAEIVYSLAGPPPGTPGSDTDRVGGLVSQWLEKDFFISIDRNTSAAGERFYRTIRGLYVPSQYVNDVEGPSYHGLIVGPDMPLPIGFVGRGRPTTYTRGSGSRALVESGRISRQAHRFLREQERVGSIDYWVTTDGQYVRAHNFGVAAEQDPPPGVAEDGRWVQIDLSDQLLVAYQGRRPVFAALVSTGKEGFETPAGSYSIASKHVSATMDGITEADGAYSIEDVPWTMFFSDNFAIHGAFWHNRFGMTKSHGCVNMSPIDAKWIFEWSEPRVPEGWHGVFGSNVQPGSVVIVRE